MTSRIVNAMLAALAAFVLCLAGYGLVQFAQPVQASSGDPSCVHFLTPGN